MICFDIIEDEVVLKCKHKMCKKCLKQLHAMKCPYCRSNMITTQNVNKVISNIIQKVLEYEQNKKKCDQILQTIDKLYERVHKNEMTVSELTRQILLTMMNISNCDVVKQIINEETYSSVININY